MRAVPIPDARSQSHPQPPFSARSHCEWFAGAGEVTHFVFAADERICKGKPQSTALVFSNAPALDIRVICIELYLVLDGQINK